MRKVRNQNVYSNNPGLMFARGVESIVSERLNRQPQDYQEISQKQRVANKQDSRGNLFTILMRQFANI